MKTVLFIWLLVAVISLPGPVSPESGCVPDYSLSTFPDQITLIPAYHEYPGDRRWNEMLIRNGCSLPVDNAHVDVIFDEAALLCWCVGQAQPVVTGYTDTEGRVAFDLFGGGCIPESDDHPSPARILVDGILGRRVSVNSPDVVDDQGLTALEGWNPQGTCGVKGNDGVWHTTAIINNLVEPCSNFDQTKSRFDPVTGVDASILTPFIVDNSSCATP